MLLGRNLVRHGRPPAPECSGKPEPSLCKEYHCARRAQRRPEKDRSEVMPADGMPADAKFPKSVRLAQNGSSGREIYAISSAINSKTRHLCRSIRPYWVPAQ